MKLKNGVYLNICYWNSDRVVTGLQHWIFRKVAVECHISFPSQDHVKNFEHYQGIESNESKGWVIMTHFLFNPVCNACHCNIWKEKENC